MTISRRSFCIQSASVAAASLCLPRLAYAKSYNALLAVPQTVKRSRSNDDWLAAAGNLAAYQSEIAIGEGVVLQQIQNAQRWRDLFDADTGLAKSDLAAFAADAGLKLDGRAHQSLDHWHALLLQSGPLWLGVANQSFKAGQVWVLLGIVGDGTPDRTDISIVNLETGGVDKMTAKEFEKLYQAAAKADGITGDIDIQVLRLT
ncbi:MAG TPA: papain-like cysteine protease family protein [Terriglobales bacterium]|nr:papain-like cysteine protease family protein [Terriglobales bacterium]